MEIQVIGLNHRTAPVEIREKLTFNNDELKAAANLWQKDARLKEGLILSTCNRTEFYIVYRDECSDAPVTELLESVKNISFGQICECIYRKTENDAVRHLLRVTSGLDSMVLGETQILGQVKDAYLKCDQLGMLSCVLHALGRQALTCGKRVQTETGINKNAASVSYAAVELAKKIFVSLEDKTVIIIGAGQMSELTLQHLFGQGVKEIFILNRTKERARCLASKFGGKIMDYTQMLDALTRADIIITSTDAPHYVIKYKQMESAMRQRKNKPIFLIDIAVPRDVEPKCTDLENVNLYDIDDLEAVVAANIKERKAEAKIAERIVDEELAEFQVWLKTQDVVPLIAALRCKAENIRRVELNRTLNRLSGLSKKDQEYIDKLTRSIVNQILREPVLQIKELALNDKSEVYSAVLCRLFDLTDEVENSVKNSEETSYKKVNCKCSAAVR